VVASSNHWIIKKECLLEIEVGITIESLVKPRRHYVDHAHRKGTSHDSKADPRCLGPEAWHAGGLCR